jgi:hypothetical protein
MPAKKKTTPPSDDTQWMVSTEAVDQDFESLVHTLKRKGLKIENENLQVMPALGIVCGAAPREFKEQVENLKHVSNVEEQQSVHLAPPDSKIQWSVNRPAGNSSPCILCLASMSRPFASRKISRPDDPRRSKSKWGLEIAERNHICFSNSAASTAK